MANDAVSPRLQIPSSRRGLSAFLLSLVPPMMINSLGAGWALATGIPATGWAGWTLFQAIVHPRVNLGKRWSLLGLALSGVTTYAALGDVAREMLWRRAFQLTPELTVYEDPVDKWRVAYPALWGHQNVSGTGNHMFRPSKVTPAMSFSVTCRPNVGTQDLALVVEGFFMNLPKGGQTEILEKEPVVLPTGHQGFRIVYTELSRRIPLKNEVLFVLDQGKLYFLSVQATPRWFDRHRAYLEKLLYSLTLPS